MQNKKITKDTRLDVRMSTELKTKIIPVSTFVLNAIKMQLDK